MTIKGNLIDIAEQGQFDVIVHGCNCFHTMGAGIAKEISSRYPQALEADKKFTKKGSYSKLGGYSHAIVTAPLGHQFTIVNAYTQYYYGRGKGDTPLADYDAIASVFNLIANHFKRFTIGYPRIGAGLAGGDWNRIQSIINIELEGTRHFLVTL